MPADVQKASGHWPAAQRGCEHANQLRLVNLLLPSLLGLSGVAERPLPPVGHKILNQGPAMAPVAQSRWFS
jgi:hypothetical protein